MDLKDREIRAQIRDWRLRLGVYSQVKPLLLRGARQVGKTHTLLQIGRTEFGDFHHLNFLKEPSLASLFDGDLNPQKILSQLGALRGKTIVPGKSLLIFDEVQEAPRALASLKNFKEELPELHLAACGSHLGVHLTEESYPVGQVHELEMFPLSFYEFCSNFLSKEMCEILTHFNLESEIPEAFHQVFWGLYVDYLSVGGMPEVVANFRRHLLGNSLQKSEALDLARLIQNTLVTGYSADFSKHAGKTNAVQIEKIFRSLPRQLGQSIETSVQRFKFKEAIGSKTSYQNLSNPIEWLEKSQLILRSYVIEAPQHPLRSQAKDSLFKLYLFDVGLLGAMMDLPMPHIQSQSYGTYKGFYAENFVAQELRAKAQYPLFSWAKNTSEVEFILSSKRTGKIFPVEVKSGFSQRAKSLSVYIQKYSPEIALKLSANSYQKPPANSPAKTLINLPIYLASSVCELKDSSSGASDCG